MQPPDADLHRIRAALLRRGVVPPQPHLLAGHPLPPSPLCPRERFVGPGPWMIQSCGTHWFTESADPRNVYRDALIVLDETKRLNNGQPSLWALHLSLLDVRPGDQILHLGCGTGYYTAILAELTGPQGKVTAIEIDEGLAARARVALEPWPQGHRDPCRRLAAGLSIPPISSSSAPAPRIRFLPGSPPSSPRQAALSAHFHARPRNHGLPYPQERRSLRGRCSRARFFLSILLARAIPPSSTELAHALKRDEGSSVRSLRCDAHEKNESCWLHGNGWCFSRLPRSPISAQPPPPTLKQGCPILNATAFQGGKPQICAPERSVPGAPNPQRESGVSGAEGPASAFVVDDQARTWVPLVPRIWGPGIGCLPAIVYWLLAIDYWLMATGCPTAPAPATSPCASADSPQSLPACPRPQCARRLRRPPAPDRSPSRRS